MRTILFKTYLEVKNDKEFQIPKKDKEGRVIHGVLPKGLEQFVESSLFIELGQSILDYTQYLIQLEDKKRRLEADALKRNIPVPKILKSEIDRVNELAKRMSDNYGRLLFKYKSFGLGEVGSSVEDKCHSMLQFRTKISLNKMTDQFFYEDVIKIYQKGLKNAFMTLDRPRVE